MSSPGDMCVMSSPGDMCVMSSPGVCHGVFSSPGVVCVCYGVLCIHLVSCVCVMVCYVFTWCRVYHVFTWCHVCVMSSPGVICIQQLEALLPARVDVKLPTGENVMEVDLMDYEPNQHGSHDRREAYDEDDDEDHMGAGPRVQCAHQ